jgi:putative ABC transport system permease protein
MIVLVGSLHNSIEGTSAILNSTGTHLMAFLPSCQSSSCRQKLSNEDEGFVANGISTSLIPISFVDEVQKLPFIKDAAPFLLFQFRDPKDNHLFTIGGFNPRDTIAVSTTSCASSDIVNGRFLKPNDSGKVMVEEAYAQLRGIKVSDQIIISGEVFTVAGIVNAGIRPAKANIYMIYDDAKKTINKRIKETPITNQANILLVEAKNAKVQDAAIQSIKELFPSLLFSSYNCYKPAAKVMGLDEKAVWSLTIVIAIATIIISLKSQLSSVLERRRDIGILKSIGWSNRSVVSQILVESILQAIIGGGIGCLAGFILLFYTPLGLQKNDMIFFKDSFFILLFVASLVLSLIGGIVAGSFPSFLAARQQPVDALKNL